MINDIHKIKLPSGSRHPEAIAIYVPGDGNFNMFGCHKVGQDWKFSKVITEPESYLNEFLGECLNQGMFVMDCRLQAKAERPGMETATPIVIANRGIDLKVAMSAVSALHHWLVEWANSKEQD